MIERDFYSKVQKYLKHVIKETCVVELKLTKGGTFLLSDLKPHQIDNLRSVSLRSLVYKLPDVGFDQKPFDIISFHKTNAYVGIIFYIPRKKKTLYLIKIEDILPRYDTHKSLTESECATLASHTAFL